jgi:hypothetical protein
MTALAWDAIGERRYETGIDRGVLYLHDGTTAPWNGLTSVEEATTSEIKSYYLEGVKFLENYIPGDFEAKIKAFTYPEEFDQVNGLADVQPGLDIYDQPASSFNLAYRTKIGNDVSQDCGYKIHILYNVIANPDSVLYNTLDDSGVQPTQFGWSLSGTPIKLVGFRPTVHISIDSTITPPDVMQVLEDQLYGTETSDPRLPSMSEIAGYFGYLQEFIVVDHGDGTWTGIDSADNYITMLDETTFQIDNADATYLDADTYTISSTSSS